MVFLSRCHLSNDTPSVSPYGLPAPPSGSRVQPPLKGEGGASRRRGQAQYAEYHLKCTKANSYRPAPSAPERGAAAAAAEGCGKRLRFCQGLGKSVQSTTHILRIRLRFYKTSTAYRETPQSGPKGLPAPLSGALFLLPPLGVVLRAANQDSNDCRWQSYICFVPRSGKGGDVGWLRAVHVTT